MAKPLPKARSIRKVSSAWMALCYRKVSRFWRMKYSQIELDALPRWPEAGILLLPQTLDHQLVRHWREIAEQFYQKIQLQSPEAIQKSLPAGQKYVPTASSFTLEAVFTQQD